MVRVTREFADHIAGVSQLLDEDEVPDDVLQRLTALGAELIPGGNAAAMTIAMDKGALMFAASDPRLDELHRVQFDRDDGPVVEALRHNEPRRIDDTAAERRWPAFCVAAAEAGFRSCLVLPLRTDRQPAGAVTLYGHDPYVFRGAAHDIALLLAAQGGTAVRNASLYRTCRRMVGNLHVGLESRAVIEQAKGILHAELGVSVEESIPPAEPSFPEHQPAGQEALRPARPGPYIRSGDPPILTPRAGRRLGARSRAALPGSRNRARDPLLSLLSLLS